MIKIKRWLLTRILPTWAKDSLLRDNDRLRMANAAQAQKIAELEAYIAGLEYACRYRSRIRIYNNPEIGDSDI